MCEPSGDAAMLGLKTSIWLPMGIVCTCNLHRSRSFLAARNIAKLSHCCAPCMCMCRCIYSSGNSGMAQQQWYIHVRVEGASENSMQSPPTCISVEAFLWHPHSIKYSIEKGKYTYNDQLLAGLDDEENSDEQDANDYSSNIATSSSRSSSSSSSLHIELPPRLVVAGKHNYDLQKVAEQWAARRKYVIVAFGHVIACASSKRLLFVDFVMQKRSSQGDGRCYSLACVYYSQCRGGADLLVAKQYMQQVQRVCNEQMQFFPRMIALCAYDGDRASAFFCSGQRTKRGSMMLGRFDIRKTAAATFWRRANHNLQPKVYAFDVTV